MSRFNFFNRASVSSTDFSRLSWDFISQGILLINESSNIADVVQYSFDGINVHGDLTPTTDSAALTFNGRKESAIFLKLASAGSSVSVRVEVWGI